MLQLPFYNNYNYQNLYSNYDIIPSPLKSSPKSMTSDQKGYPKSMTVPSTYDPTRWYYTLVAP